MLRQYINLLAPAAMCANLAILLLPSRDMLPLFCMAVEWATLIVESNLYLSSFSIALGR